MALSKRKSIQDLTSEILAKNIPGMTLGIAMTASLQKAPRLNRQELSWVMENYIASVIENHKKPIKKMEWWDEDYYQKRVADSTKSYQEFTDLIPVCRKSIEKTTSFEMARPYNPYEIFSLLTTGKMYR